ncbi:MAG: OadG family protein [Fuerstiella sp.]|nr:OadG family protein [Fuerstiella sp.]
MLPAFMISLAQTVINDGFPIAATGMGIVFVAIILITVFISALPGILKLLAQVLPEASARHTPVDTSESMLPDEGILAAIGFVLHTEIQRQVTTDERTGR